MGRTTSLITAVATWVSSDRPADMHPNSATIRMSGGAQAFIFHSIPTDLYTPGTVVISAKLRLTDVVDAYGTPTGLANGDVYNVRALTSALNVAATTWNNKPTVDTEVYSATVTSDSQTSIEVDITAAIQAVVNGQSWYGLRVEAPTYTGPGFLSGVAAAAKWQIDPRPTLIITYTVPPNPPQELHPRAGDIVSVPKPILTWVYSDPDGDAQASFQVQVNPTNSWGSPAYDSGIQNTNRQSYNLTTLSGFPGCTNGGQMWWRVKTKDATGVWSDWSLPAEFGYVLAGTLTVTSPAASGTVSDPSPLVTWTFSGATQVAYQVLVTADPALLPNGQGPIIYDSGKIFSTSLQHQTPSSTLNHRVDVYNVVVRVWDDNPNRVATSGIPAYVEVTNTFNYSPANDVDPVDGVTLAASDFNPLVILYWHYDRTTSPTFYVFRYTTQSAASLNNYQYIGYVNTDDGAGNYQFSDWWIPGRRTFIYEVIAVVPNGSGGYKAAVASDPLTYTRRSLWPWLVSTQGNPDGSDALPLINAEIDTDLDEVSSVVDPMGVMPYLVTQKLGAITGSVTAELRNKLIPGRFAEDMVEQFLWIRQMHPECYLSWADRAIKVMIYNCSFKALPSPDGTTDYEISFDFVQTGGYI